MNDLYTRIGEVFRPVNTPAEEYQHYPSVAWDKKPKTDQVEEAEVVESIALGQVRISPATYRLALELLLNRLSSELYVSNISIVFDSGDYECHFDISCFVYSRMESNPEGDEDKIYDLIPTWWEFHTLKDGEEVLNDFSFAEFKKYL